MKGETRSYIREESYWFLSEGAAQAFEERRKHPTRTWLRDLWHWLREMPKYKLGR